MHWLKPELVAEVKFAEWTSGGVLRHASFLGLREDKPTREIVREGPVNQKELAGRERHDNFANKTEKEDRASPLHVHAPDANPSHSRPGKPPAADAQRSIAGVVLTHPSRILFADNGVTKFDLAKYYDDVSDWILPHLADRPLTLVRCPHGGEKPCFFQKHVTDAIDENIQRVTVPAREGQAQYMMANTLPALISMVQIGVLEIHTWGAKKVRLDKPDRIIFDLDPAPDVAWSTVIEAAQLVRSLLEDIGLQSFLKTTGGKGLHVAVPIKPERPWDDVKAFSRAFAEHLATLLPDRFTASMSKARRNGKIFIDYLRNASEATAVAAFSSRARPGAPVSTPLAWDELSVDLRSDSFNVINLHSRLRNLAKDPWKEYFTNKQRLTSKMLKIFDDHR